MFDFAITSQKGKARTGVFKTLRGVIETPVFMPVGTYGAVKTLVPWELEQLGSQIILGNTYHLYLRPGDQEIAKLGGLHQFMNWPRPLLTDSGGFQVYSIGDRQKINEEGIIFRSHIDGSEHEFTPEKSIQIQKNLGADIIMAFDDVAGISTGREELQKSMQRTHRWLERCIIENGRRKTENGSRIENSLKLSNVRCQVSDVVEQALFGIVQGGFEVDLRKQSAEFIASKNLPGNAIGGLAMPGDYAKFEIRNSKLETNSKFEILNSKQNQFKQQMWEIVEQVCEILPENKPRYLMGVGEPADIIKAISLGCDMFDCVLPTRLARHGTVWVNVGKVVSSQKKVVRSRIENRKEKIENSSFFYKRINLFNAKFKADPRPIDENCHCPTCSPVSFSTPSLPYTPSSPYLPFSRSYLRHLLVSNEVLGIRLLSMHNIWFINQLIEQIKKEITLA